MESGPKKKVMVRHSFTVEEEVPADWEEDMVVSFFNESCWCSTNALRDRLKEIDAGECLCFSHHATVDTRRAADEP